FGDIFKTLEVSQAYRCGRPEVNTHSGGRREAAMQQVLVARHIFRAGKRRIDINVQERHGGSADFAGFVHDEIRAGRDQFFARAKAPGDADGADARAVRGLDIGVRVANQAGTRCANVERVADAPERLRVRLAQRFERVADDRVEGAAAKKLL